MPKSTTKRFHRNTPWLKRVLIPFWFIQVLLVTFHLGVQIWASLITVASAVGILTMLICFICIILDKAEIILFARGTLKPLTYLVFQCVKTGLWFIIFMLTILASAVWTNDDLGSDEYIMWGVLIEAVVLFTAFISTLIYGSVVYHRSRIAARLARSRSALNHERYDPFYNGPFSDPRIIEADYSRDQDDSTRPPTYVEYNDNHNYNDDSHNAFPDQTHAHAQTQGNDAEGLLLESGGQEVALPPPPRSSGWRQELEGDRETFELAANRSVRSFGPLG